MVNLDLDNHLTIFLNTCVKRLDYTANGHSISIYFVDNNIHIDIRSGK